MRRTLTSVSVIVAEPIEVETVGFSGSNGALSVLTKSKMAALGLFRVGPNSVDMQEKKMREE